MKAENKSVLVYGSMLEHLIVGQAKAKKKIVNVIII